jgi:hypothetical protein
VAGDIDNGTPAARSPVVRGQRLLLHHALQLLSCGQPHALVVDVVDEVELLGPQLVRGASRAKDSWEVESEANPEWLEGRLAVEWPHHRPGARNPGVGGQLTSAVDGVVDSSPLLDHALDRDADLLLAPDVARDDEAPGRGVGPAHDAARLRHPLLVPAEECNALAALAGE